MTYKKYIILFFLFFYDFTASLTAMETEPCVAGSAIRALLPYIYGRSWYMKFDYIQDCITPEVYAAAVKAVS